MRDNGEERLERLFAAARSDRPDTAAAEERFETRLMARIREQREGRVPWYLFAWRSIPVFVLIALLLSVAGFSTGSFSSTDLFASISGGQEEYLAKSFLAGE